MTITDTTPARASINWRADAACAGMDAELWFPVGDSGPARLQATEAKRVCRTACPVREICLRWALDNGIDHGVFGGHTEDERRAIRRNRNGVVDL